MHPILFTVGPIQIYSYGVMVSLAFAICSFLIWRTAPRVGLDREKVLDFIIVILVFGIIGARFLHVAANFRYYIKHPFEIILLTKGGLAFYGGVLFSIIAGIIYLRKNSIPIWKAGDLIAPYVALGQSIGRIGCFLNGCCYGIICAPAHLHLGVIFRGDTLHRYPTQIFATIILLFIYMALRFMLERQILKENLFLVYLILYSFQRFFMEFLRGDINRILWNLTLSQLISVCVFITALTMLIRRKPIGKA